MDVAIEFVVDVIVTNVLERLTACRALETINMEVLVLYADKDAAGFMVTKKGNF